MKDQSGHWIWGWHSVEACLRSFPELVLELLSENDIDKSLSLKLEPLARESGVKISKQSSLPKHLAERRTQGVAARIKYFPSTLFKSYLDCLDEKLSHGGQWALLDGVQDPRNFGALLRSAAAFGVQAVFIPERGQAPLNGVVAQSSAGNLFVVECVVCGSLTKVVEAFRERGALTAALAADGKDLRAALKASGARSLLWIVGAEGKGLRNSLMGAAEQIISIPMAPEVESLNVSAAASIAFFEASQKFFAKPH